MAARSDGRQAFRNTIAASPTFINPTNNRTGTNTRTHSITKTCITQLLDGCWALTVQKCVRAAAKPRLAGIRTIYKACERYGERLKTE